MDIQIPKVVETRRLATFRTVDSIEPIENADAIELAVVGGWKVVTKKGEFKIGDPCVYFEIDSFLPDGVSAWQFLIDKQPRMMGEVKGHRLRTIRLRGQISQGLILPTFAHPATKLVLSIDDAAFEFNAQACTEAEIEEAKHLRFGMDEHILDPRDLSLNKLLGIVKWDPPLPAQLAGLVEGLFPSWIRKTDEERAQNLKGEIFGYIDEETLIPGMTADQADLAVLASGRLRVIGNEVFSVRPAKARRDAQYEITMKLDGSSATFFHRDGKLGVCSRNLELKICDENKENSFVRMLFDSGLNFALPAYGNIAVQGELMGPNIQKNREGLKDFQLFVFNVQLLDEGRYMTPAERYAFMKELGGRGVNVFAKVFHAPVLRLDGSFTDTVFDLPTEPEGHTLDSLGLDTMEKLLAAAEGPSIVHPVSEGKVYKRLDGAFSFKTISNEYLAKEKD